MSRRTNTLRWANGADLLVEGQEVLNYEDWSRALRSLAIRLDSLGSDLDTAYVLVTAFNAPDDAFRLRLPEARLLAYHGISLGVTIAG